MRKFTKGFEVVLMSLTIKEVCNFLFYRRTRWGRIKGTNLLEDATKRKLSTPPRECASEKYEPGV